MSITTNKVHPLVVLHEKNLLRPLLAAIVALVAGIYLGTAISATDSYSTAQEAPLLPAQTSIPVKTKTVTVTTIEVPEECLLALKRADRGFELASAMTSQYQVIVHAIKNNDIGTARNAARYIRSVNKKVDQVSLDYIAHQVPCRVSSQQ